MKPVGKLRAVWSHVGLFICLTWLLPLSHLSQWDGGVEHAQPCAGHISDTQKKRRWEPRACEDKCCGTTEESLSPKEGWSSQLRSKDMPSDGWQKAIFTVGVEREYAWWHQKWLTGERKGKSKCEKCVCTHGKTNSKLGGMEHVERQRHRETCPETAPPLNRHIGHMCACTAMKTPRVMLISGEEWGGGTHTSGETQ